MHAPQDATCTFGTLNTQITCTRHETVAKDSDHRPFVREHALIVFIPANPTKIQIYRQLLLATQIPPNTQVFDRIWVANIKY